jgi:outer membrane protein
MWRIFVTIDLKKIGVFLISCLFITAAHAEVRIGYVDPVKLLDKAPQTQAAKDQVEKEFKPRDTQLVAQQKELRNKEEQLKRDGGTMSSSTRQKLETDISRLKREIKRDLDDFREDFTLARNRIMAKLQKRINEAIVKLAKNENYDLIVGDSVIFASKNIDVTDKILKILREEFKKENN